MMFIRLFFLELRRLVLGWRFAAALLILLAFSGYSLYSAYQELAQVREDITTDPANAPPTLFVQGALSVHASQWLPMTVPLVAGLVAAGSLARDRRWGYVPLVLSRGVSRWNYMLAKGLAMASSAALAVLLGGLLFLFLAWLVLLPGRPPLEQYLLGTDAQHNFITLPLEQGSFPGPYPLLFAQSPVLGDVTSLAIIALGAAALALTGLIVGALVSNQYIAIIAPFAVVLLGLLFFTVKADAVNPYTYMDVWSRYRTIMVDAPASTPFVYWIIFGALAMGIGSALFTRQEVS
jgi:ABC-type transport system involved in multi-copper enzyme maturation permease subunit